MSDDLPGDDTVTAAHAHSIRHRDEIARSASCGCFYCTRVFAPAMVERWIDGGATALCPYCGIDSVIGDASGYAITRELLARMKARWF